MKFVKPKFFREWNDIRKEGGLKLLLKQKGPIVLVVFFLYYLIRDSILYILIPVLIAKEIITCA
ncbi:MAG: hypothetical protein CMG18_04475 [Candidatus Marinimicrobia bacterium]|jgi:hypothetical protein|nr:hypothetical protein [Candidatus Neomarinimicrobiota bacterium]MAR75619.1 hypothetical protein [Candidatus Neomarinimicrobiota bacterium]|tara:strand:- start:527 stop:718 length:192 start_codon:yes stop_codon:yes gene_type:complete